MKDYKTAHIEEEVHKRLKVYCAENGETILKHLSVIVAEYLDAKEATKKKK